MLRSNSKRQLFLQNKSGLFRIHCQISFLWRQISAAGRHAVILLEQMFLHGVSCSMFDSASLFPTQIPFFMAVQPREPSDKSAVFTSSKTKFEKNFWMENKCIESILCKICKNFMQIPIILIVFCQQSRVNAVVWLILICIWTLFKTIVDNYLKKDGVLISTGNFPNTLFSAFKIFSTLSWHFQLKTSFLISLYMRISTFTSG